VRGEGGKGREEERKRGRPGGWEASVSACVDGRGYVMCMALRCCMPSDVYGVGVLHAIPCVEKQKDRRNARKIETNK